MSDINKVFLIGRLTKDCTTRQVGQNTVTEFSVAVNRTRKQGTEYVEETSYIDVRLWNGNIAAYLLKGKQVGIDGELRQERWEKDGVSNSKVIVVANNVKLLGGDVAKPAPAQAPKYTTPSYPAAGGPEEFDDGGDIPF